jgi:predicted AAA+ superfamily ATPase
MLRRLLHDEILRTLKSFPAILLTGARQVGKSTLAQQLVSP